MQTLRRFSYAFLVFALLLSMLSALPASALTDCAPGPHTVTGSQNVNARLGASTSARILRAIAPGTTLNVTAQELGVIVSGNGIWCAIDLDGQTAYVHSGALVAGGGAPPAAAGDPAANAPAAGGQTYHVAGTGSINGRATASTSGRIVVAIPGRTDVTVIGTVSGGVVNGSATWFEVSYNGQNVFVHGSLLAAGSVQAPVQAQPQQQGQQPASAGLPIPESGIWTVTLDPTTYGSCEGTETITFPTSDFDDDLTFTGSLTASRDGSTLIIDGDPYPLQGENTYVGSFTFSSRLNAQLYLNINSPTHITGHATTNFNIDGIPCSATFNISLTKN